MPYLRHNNTANSLVLGTFKNQHRKETTMDSTRIRLYPLEADHGFLGLSTSPANNPTALHLGGCMVAHSKNSKTKA